MNEPNVLMMGKRWQMDLRLLTQSGSRRLWWWWCHKESMSKTTFADQNMKKIQKKKSSSTLSTISFIFCDNYMPLWWDELDDELSWLFTHRFRAKIFKFLNQCFARLRCWKKCLEFTKPTCFFAGDTFLRLKSWKTLI